jgi:hypothetical protein
MRFNTFDEVVWWYERTKPIISSNHTKEHDVRPIANRKRKWERIKKIDANTYALLDGNYGNTTHAQEYEEYEDTMAPITWMRREDGDFIRIRNHTKGGCSVTRYNFLIYHLPTYLQFGYNQQGKHWIDAKTPTGYVNFPLPKCNVKFDYQKNALVDDDVYLMFRVNGDGTFTRVGDPLKVEVKRVDKELKKQWRERVDNFYGYCAAIAPMIQSGRQVRNEYINQITKYFDDEDQGNLRGLWVRSGSDIPQDLVRAVVSDDEHSMRVAVAALIVHEISGKREVKTKEDLQSIKAAYNRVMNKAMGFYKIEEK